MSRITILPPVGPVKGIVDLPLSKSISNRLIILAFLSNNRQNLSTTSDSDDSRFLKEALFSNSENWFVGDGGTTSRFLLATACVLNQTRIIDGSEQIKRRPIDGLVKALQEIGFKIEFLGAPGTLPVRIHPIELSSLSDSVSIDVSKSSQFLSALLLIAPFLPKGLNIFWNSPLVSSPYVEMTLSLLRQFGAKFHEEVSNIRVQNGTEIKSIPKGEADWSSASYWYQIAALSASSEIMLKGLRKHSLQGDKVISKFFECFGVKTEFSEEGALIKSTGKISGIQANLIDHPDLAPALVSTSAALEVKSTFRGLQTLKFKETDRINSLNEELSRIGWILNEEGGIWQVVRHDIGTRNNDFSSHGDHRIAMCLAPLAITLGQMSLGDYRVVTKSYPNFFNDLESVGFTCKS